MNVTFHAVPGYDVPPPFPAKRSVPSWYRDLPADLEGETYRSAKACVPFLEAMTAGFIIPVPHDYFVLKDGSVSAPFVVNLTHPGKQFRGRVTPKFESGWVIRTPPGYSCLFKHPEHRDLPFRILEGIVDTDTYPNAVNFPFEVTPGFIGPIPRGTPMVQVIPFRREDWEFSEGPAAAPPIPPGRDGYRRRWWHRNTPSP